MDNLCPICKGKLTPLPEKIAKMFKNSEAWSCKCGYVKGISKGMYKKSENMIIAHRTDRNELYTYSDLLKHLQSLTKEQLTQPVQLYEDGPEEENLLSSVIGIGTCQELFYVDGECCTFTRSIDFEHHPEHIVLVADGPPHDKFGNTAFEMVTGEDGELYFKGDKTGKLKPIIDRKDCEVSVSASRSPVFAKQLRSKNKALEQRLEELAQKAKKETLSAKETEEVNILQAELYRRLYGLPAQKERKKNVVPENG